MHLAVPRLTAQNGKLGVVGVILWVGRGLAPAVNLHRTPRRGQALALPCKLYFVRVGNGLDRSVKLYQITRANTVRPYE